MPNLPKHRRLLGYTLLAVVVAFVVAFVAGCGPVPKPDAKSACQVIDAANKACAVVKYLGDDGKPAEVQLTPDEVAALGKATAAKRAGAK